jgi:hypothetical protein
MGSVLNESEGVSSSTKTYKKPALKRHGLVSELTRGSGRLNISGGDSYTPDGYTYTYS